MESLDEFESEFLPEYGGGFLERSQGDRVVFGIQKTGDGGTGCFKTGSQLAPGHVFGLEGAPKLPGYQLFHRAGFDFLGYAFLFEERIESSPGRPAGKPRNREARL